MPFLLKKCQEMSLPIHFVRKDTDTFYKLRIAVSPFWNAFGKSFIIFHGNKGELRPLGEKPGDDFLILSWCKGTGRVKHHASRLEHICRIQGKLALDKGKLPGFFRSPVPGKCLLFAEHSFTGAGSIQNDFVEKFRKAFRQLFRFFICNKKVGNTK